MAQYQRSHSITQLPNGTEIGEPILNGVRNLQQEDQINSNNQHAAPSLMSQSCYAEISHSKASDECSGSQRYVDEWKRLFKGPDFIAKLKNEGMAGRLRSSRFRSVCWRIYLECLSEDQSQWVREITKARERYDELTLKFLTNPRLEFEADLASNNPLSQDEDSPWNQFFKDGEQKVVIRQDVIRTFPEIEFFHSVAIRDMMVNILFCYAREFPHVLYKQGMHEILAPLIFVLHSDHQAFLHATEIELVDETVKTLLNPAFIEHDAYFMFSQVMDVVEPWYLVREIHQPRLDLMSMQPFARPQDLQPTNVIIFKLTRIHDHLLKRYDCELFTYLERLEIAPQIYGIRWLRLLFGREFPLQDLLVVWDAIFADSSVFDLVDYIFIAMLTFIRNLLLCNDYASCLSHLMRYPAVTDVQYIIGVALHLRDPNNYKKPNGYSVQMLQHVPTVGGRSDIHRIPLQMGGSVETLRDSTKDSIPKSGSKMMSGFSTLTKKMASRPKSLAINPDVLKAGKMTVKASSEPSTFESRSPSPTLAEYHRGVSDEMHTSYRPEFEQETELKLLNDRTGNASTRNRADFDDDDDDVPPASPGKGFTRRGSWTMKRTKELKKFKGANVDAAYVLGQLNEIQTMCRSCSHKMTMHIERLQECVLRQRLENEDEMLIALAGLKQVRDILKGTLKFSDNLLDGEAIVISDNHYPVEPNSKEASCTTSNLNFTELQEVNAPPICRNIDNFQEVNLVTE